MGIARTSKRLGLRSESSHRFERGIDPDAVAVSAARACELLEQVAGGRVSPELVDAYPRPTARQPITLRTERVARVLGVDVDATGVRTALEPLGIDVQGGPDFTVTAPTWRPDLEREIDLVEEVGRRIGLASIPQTLPAVTQTGGLTGRQRDRRVVVDALAGFGCSEAVTVPLIAPAQLERLGLPTHDLVEAVNSLRADETVLRPWILPGLLGVVERNAAHGLVDVAVFEVGHVFRPPRPGDVLPDERDHLAVILAGHVRRRPVEPDRPVDGYDVADAVRVLGDALGLAALALRPGEGPGFVPGRSAEVRLDGTVIGHAGELVGVNGADAVVGLELDLDALLAGARRDRTFRQPSRAPSSTVDLAFELPEGVPAAEVAGTIAAAGGEVVEAVDLFDEFRSEALGEGRRSLAYRVRYRAPDHTLTAEEIGTLRQAAIDAVTATHRAELRGEGG
jgi:phenylalanyl-tRNA synthetase beta chain